MLKSVALLWALILLHVTVPAPVAAHKEHKKKQPVSEQVVQPGAQPGERAAMQGGPTAAHAQMGEMMEEDRSKMPLG
jgi:hypothetical protein